MLIIPGQSSEILVVADNYRFITVYRILIFGTQFAQEAAKEYGFEKNDRMVF